MQRPLFNFATMQPSRSETCDPEGDIRLTAPLTILGVKQQKTFLVSSKAMRLACDVWNKMLAPDSPFLEAKEVGHGKLSFPEDDAAPLAILLHIAHLNFDKVSHYISFQQLLDLAVLTDKYGATKLVRPWIQSWIAVVQHLLLQPAYEEWLWIAWEFGQSRSFRQLAVHLVQEVKRTADGQCVTQKGRILDPSADNCHLPPDIIGTSKIRTITTAIAYPFAREHYGNPTEGNSKFVRHIPRFYYQIYERPGF